MRNRIVALAVVAAAVPASALAATTVSDPKDAGQSRLDLKTVTADGSGSAIAITLRTWANWPTSLLAKPSSKLYACVYVWKDGSDTQKIFDFQICSNSGGGSLETTVYDVAKGKVVKTKVKASRAGGNGLRYSIPKSLLGGGSRFSWRAGTRDGGTTSLDAAPNGAPKS